MNETFDTHAAIDDVARRFTAGEAPANLRANVLARLEDRRAPAWWREPRMAVAAALIVLVAAGAAIVQLRRPTIAPSASMVAAVTPLSVQPASVESPVAVTSTATAAVSHRPAPAPPSEAELAWRARAVPALPLPEAITFDAIQPDALVIPLLDVTPIVMPPIALPADGGGSR